jgi:hypothetical protein
VGNAVGDDARLAAACPCQDKQRPLGLFHRGALLDIELVKQIRHAGLWGRTFPSRAKKRVEPEDSLYTMREAANKLWAAMQGFEVWQILAANRAGGIFARIS